MNSMKEIIEGFKKLNPFGRRKVYMSFTRKLGFMHQIKNLNQSARSRAFKEVMSHRNINLEVK